MFANFSLDKLTNTITTAAQSAQETINNKILSPDAQTKLQFKKTTRFFQEKVGAIPADEISKLPQDYQQLELKVDALEKILNRLLLVSKTFELEGYDYPPNLTESLNHWWNEEDEEESPVSDESNEDSENSKKNTTKINEIDPSILNRSFAIAISKAVLDSQQIYVNLKKKEEEGFSKVDSADDEEDEEEDDDLNNLIKTFQSWSQCYKNIDQSKNDMDTMIVKEFNQKLIDLLEIDFKTVRKLRSKVQESRLEFDTMRHEIKLKNELKEQAEKEAAAKVEHEVSNDVKPEESAKEETKEESEDGSAGKADTKEEVVDGKTNNKSNKKGKKDDKTKKNAKKEVDEEKKEDEIEPAPTTSISETKPQEDDEESEEDKLLEKLEDDFVSNITAAVEKMTEVTDSVEIISLVKLFQNIQLVHYRQCVQELEASMKLLDDLPIDVDED
ncbi:hypothetical protein MOUN0_A00408 [Monosporozyma unispora]